jgi:hypothetical protein
MAFLPMRGSAKATVMASESYMDSAGAAMPFDP